MTSLILKLSVRRQALYRKRYEYGGEGHLTCEEARELGRIEVLMDHLDPTFTSPELEAMCFRIARIDEEWLVAQKRSEKHEKEARRMRVARGLLAYVLAVHLLASSKAQSTVRQVRNFPSRR